MASQESLDPVFRERPSQNSFDSIPIELSLSKCISMLTADIRSQAYCNVC